MPKAALHNLGCKVNAYETEAMKQQLAERGYEIVPFDQKADVYIINTCSVTNIADRKSRQMLHRAKKLNPEAVVVAAGCYVQVASDALKEDNSVDIIIGNNNKARLADILEEYMRDRQGNEEGYVLDIARAQEYEELHVSRLTLEKGEVDIEGTIDSMVYSSNEALRKSGESLFTRLFK